MRMTEQRYQRHAQMVKKLVPEGIETLSQYQQLYWRQTMVHGALLAVLAMGGDRDPVAAPVIGQLYEELDQARTAVEAYCEFHPEHVGEDLEQPQALSA